MFFWGAFLYLGSPSPYVTAYTHQNLIFRTIVLAAPLPVWLLSIKSSTWALRIIEATGLVFAGSTAYLLSQYIRPSLSEETWSFGWVTFAFLITNMIFLKNRQNARDDLIAMQNYTLKRDLFAMTPRAPEKEKGFELKVRI